MKYALIGDLHSQTADVKAVLADIQEKAPSAAVVGLGDLYECLIGKKKARTARHLPIEEAVLQPVGFEELLTFPSVRGNQEERITHVTGDDSFLRFPEQLNISGALVMHGHQLDWTPDWEPRPPKTEPPLLFFGHSHIAGLYRKQKKLPFQYGQPVKLQKKRYAINVGAVCFSREWVLYDAAARTVTFYRA